MPLFLRRLFNPAILLLLLSYQALGADADSVIMRSGRVFTGRVTDIARHRVMLRVSGTDDTAERRIDLRLVRRISCADGRQWPGDPQTRRLQDELYVRKRMARLAKKSNYIYLNPLSLQVLGQNVGAGAGAGYGRKLSPQSRWSAEAAATVFYTSTGGFYKSWPATGDWSETMLQGLYVTTGIHYGIPWRRGRLQSSIGLQLPLGWVNRTERYYEGGIELRSLNRRDFLLGTELAASFRILSTRSAFILFRVAGGPLIANNAAYGGTFRASFCVGFLH